jgi:acrylyl-CoA reductase (NADPH)
MSATFRCFLVNKAGKAEATAAVAEKSLDDLPPGEVLIRVAYSSLNYKDALAAKGHPGVVRSFPHVPGIDAAGTVEESEAAAFRKGQEVLVTGYDLGAAVWGGYAEYVRVPERWVVPLPSGLSLRQSMIYGTAGFTAAQSVNALLRHGVKPDGAKSGDGEIVVTGAGGGVGSIAVAILAKLGFQVAAVSGKPAAADFLKGLGAAQVLPRSDVQDTSNKPLLAARWAGAVDTVGGNTLATLLRTVRRAGCVTACGLVSGTDLNTSVYPFILRGITLAGIDSAECPMPQRLELWKHLASDWKPEKLDDLATTEVDLSGLPEQVERILRGETMGRVLVKLSEC